MRRTPARSRNVARRSDRESAGSRKVVRHQRAGGDGVVAARVKALPIVGAHDDAAVVEVHLQLHQREQIAIEIERSMAALQIRQRLRREKRQRTFVGRVVLRLGRHRQTAAAKRIDHARFVAAGFIDERAAGIAHESAAAAFRQFQNGVDEGEAGALHGHARAGPNPRQRFDDGIDEWNERRSGMACRERRVLLLARARQNARVAGGEQHFVGLDLFAGEIQKIAVRRRTDVDHLADVKVTVMLGGR